jgi:hypothetical protein
MGAVADAVRGTVARLTKPGDSAMPTIVECMRELDTALKQPGALAGAYTRSLLSST